MKIFLFDSLKDTLGKPKEWSFADFYKYKISECIQLDSKENGKLFSFADYIGGKRGKSFVKSLSGLILDFDSLNEARTPEDHESFLDGYEWAWYRTYNYTPEEPRYRLIMPFAEPIAKDAFLEAGLAIFEMLEKPSGLDQTCFGVERMYFYPAMKDPANYSSNYYFGEPIDLKKRFGIQSGEVTYSISKDFNSGRGEHGGRNNALKSQASACLDKGVLFDQCVKELIEYDKANHNPPLFEDPSENDGVINAELNATVFVSNIWKSHCRNNKNNIPVMSIEDQQIESAPVITERVEKKRFFVIPDKLALSAPGLVGQITNWITETAPSPKSALALGATLCGVGAIKGHKVRGDTNLRTNIYCLGLASSGSGKAHPLDMIEKVLVQSGNLKLKIGEPASDSGLLKGLSDAGDRGVIFWDEFGEALNGMTQEKSQPHIRKVLEEFTKLFSKASAHHTGRERANSDGKHNRRDLDQPCLSLYGVTNFRSFVDNISDKYIRNGFLPRFLALSPENDKIGEYAPHRTVDEVPQDILSEVYRINEMTPYAGPSNLVISPKCVEFEPSAHDLMHEIGHAFHNKLKRAEIEMGDDAEYFYPIWRRGAEHVRKIALTVCNDEIITFHDVDWAFKLVDICSQSMYDITLDEIGMSPFLRQVESAYNVIEWATPSGGVNTTEIYKKSRPKIETPIQMKLIIDMLLETNRIIREKNKGKKGYIFRALKKC